MKSEKLGRLYLDVDGVIIADELPFKDAREVFLDGKASETVTRTLGTLGLELVWLTTWEKAALELAEDHLPGLEGGRVLERPRDVHYQNALDWKTRRLIEDQKAEPSPYVWIDDQIRPGDVEKIQSQLGKSYASLSIIPDRNTGIDSKQLGQISRFLEEIRK